VTITCCFFQVGLKPEDEREIERQFWASIEEARLRR
jgi:hypothetical protein